MFATSFPKYEYIYFFQGEKFGFIPYNYIVIPFPLKLRSKNIFEKSYKRIELLSLEFSKKKMNKEKEIKNWFEDLMSIVPFSPVDSQFNRDLCLRKKRGQSPGYTVIFPTFSPKVS